MKMLTNCGDDKIHSRKIDVATYEFDEKSMVVCGELIDTKMVETFDIEERLRAVGVIHHMRICLKIDTRSLTIVDIEVEFPKTPHPECIEIKDNLAVIRGMKIASGFTSNVKKLVGSRKGCTHLTTLLLTMAPAIMQGYWAHVGRDLNRQSISYDHKEKYLVDSCHVWRREGPLNKRVSEKLGVSLENR
jgi:hypothetical protein